ncbi:peptidase S16 [Gleimia sp. 6138-11-ORH1]|uniref:YlbL family protein n=1 Tax=Gleimia sp. 6138-11-ORH1 TaxID=2973937 RepID=UPI002166C602|nr:S16 family serine protease [Gleimia sp. 6138-11-ORH1]MCS4483904.1 peptidase S16 [Gleimia sp. 6138-11-ORH1]
MKDEELPTYGSGEQPGQHPTQPGQYPTQPGQYPAQPGQYPAQPAQYPTQPAQAGGQYPPQPGQYPTQPGQYPTQPAQYPGYPAQAGGQYPPQPGQYPTQPGQYPTQPGQHPTQPAQPNYQQVPGAYYSPIQTPREQKRPWKKYAKVLVPFAAAAAIFGVALMPLPYVVASPGPTVDVFQKDGNTPLVEVLDPGADNNPQGELRMVTVRQYGDPDNWISGWQWLQAKLTPGYDLIPMEKIFPPNVTAEELDRHNKQAMVSSQSTAAAAAFNYLDMKIPAKVTLLGATEDSPLANKIEEGDILQAVTINGTTHQIDTADSIFALTREIPAGTAIELEVLRAGNIVKIPTETYRPEQLTKFDRGSRLGVYLDVDFKLPIDVKIHLERIGGPSAGMIFSLAIIDKLTDGSLIGDNVVAGTGSISYDGEVQPIGGIVQKMHGAKRDGAKYFLAPIQNCDEVVGNVPSGIEVYSVQTLDDAVRVLQGIKNKDTAGLETCEQVMNR